MRATEKRLKDRIKGLETELETITADRLKFREEYSRNFRWLIKIHGEGKHPGMYEYIEYKAKTLRNFIWWYW